MNANGAIPPAEEVVALLRAYDDSLASGAPLSTADREALSPDLRAALEEHLDCLHLLDELRRHPRTAPAPVGKHSSAGASADERYTLTRLHAVGGIGQVWLAYDAELEREVALKELRPDRSSDASLQKRFLHEAQITGRLQHPGIVPVYEMMRGSAESALEPVGTSDEQPFYTMRFVRGHTLTAAVDEYHRNRAKGKGGSFEFIALLNAFVSVCNTVAYAHARGVIHRDLKGQNIVLGDFGEVMVLDWGLAKVLGKTLDEGESSTVRLELSTGTAEHSVPGSVMGTPAFMAPEQAAGCHERIDQRTDVFGLGAILFTILTGHPPFAGEDSKETLRRARDADAPRADAVCSGVPPALAAICGKAMARDPVDRYASASDLAREVQQWIADEPVLAYRDSLSNRLRRWARRHKPWVTAAAALLIAAPIALIAGAILIGREQAITAHMLEDKAEAETRNRRASERQLYQERIALSERELAARNLNRATQLLDGCTPELRGWEWHCLQHLSRAKPLTLQGHDAAILSVVFSPDLRHLASAGYDRTARIWDVSTGQECFRLRGHTGAIYEVAYSHDGGRLATASWDHTVKVWDASTGKELLTLRGHTEHVNRVAFGPDDRFLVSLGSNDSVRVWDAESGRPLRVLPKVQWQLGLALFPDGRHAALAVWHKDAQIWDLESGEAKSHLEGSPDAVRCLAINNGGGLLACGDGEVARGDAGRITVWDTHTNRKLYCLEGHTDPIYSVAFSPDSERLASASQDSTVKIWDLNVRREVLTLRAQDAVRSVAFSPDGRFLASAGSDRTITIWDGTPWNTEATSDEVRSFSGHHDRVFQAAFHPDGSRLATVGADHTLRLWETATGQEIATWVLGDADHFALAFSPDGHRLATALSTGQVVLLDAETGKEVQRFLGHRDGPIKCLAFSSDGQSLASASWDSTVRVWNVATGRERATLIGHQQPVTSVAFRPDGRQIASGSYDQTVRIWDADSGREIAMLRRHNSSVFSVAFSPCGKLLASASNDGTVLLWDVAKKQLLRTLRGHASAVWSVAFRSDGRMLASGSSDWTVQLWETSTGRIFHTLRGHTDRVHSVAFSPDGRHLASASFDKTAKLWKIPEGVKMPAPTLRAQASASKD
jgi:WD40 repeat protein/serine/threonine protein kinase